MKTLKKKIQEDIETITKLKQIQESKVNIEPDNQFNVGTYNGIEIALSVLEERKPKLFTIPQMEGTTKEELHRGRTVHSGIINRRS